VNAYLPATRAELYQRLGLVDAPLPKNTCGGCPDCRGAEYMAPASYAPARYVAEGRLEDIESEKAQEYIDARRRIVARSKEAERAQGYSTPTLAWAREATL
jgi:hypothetical protein